MRPTRKHNHLEEEIAKFGSSFLREHRESISGFFLEHPEPFYRWFTVAPKYATIPKYQSALCASIANKKRLLTMWNCFGKILILLSTFSLRKRPQLRTMTCKGSIIYYRKLPNKSALRNVEPNDFPLNSHVATSAKADVSH